MDILLNIIQSYLEATLFSNDSQEVCLYLPLDTYQTLREHFSALELDEYFDVKIRPITEEIKNNMFISVCPVNLSKNKKLIN